MTKGLVCVLMMTLLLTGCSGKGDSAQQEGVLVRSRYRDMDTWQGTFDLQANYGERVYQFTVELGGSREEGTALTVTQPELLAGITARITSQGEGVLEYQGTGRSLGVLDEGGLTPMSALPTLIEAVGEGYIDRCAWRTQGEEKLLEVVCRDPTVEAGEGTEYVLTFDPETYALVGGEVQVAGETVLTVTCSNFTMEMTEDDTADHEDLGGDQSGEPGA